MLRIEILDNIILLIKGKQNLLNIYLYYQDNLDVQHIVYHAFDSEVVISKVFCISDLGYLLFVATKTHLTYGWIDVSNVTPDNPLKFNTLAILQPGYAYLELSLVPSDPRIILYLENDILVTDRIVSKDNISLSTKPVTITTDFGIFKNIIKDTITDITCGVFFSDLNGRSVMIMKKNLQSYLPIIMWGIWDLQTMKLRITWRMYFMENDITALLFQTSNGDELGVVSTSNKLCLVDMNGLVYESDTTAYGKISALKVVPTSVALSRNPSLFYFVGICSDGGGTNGNVVYVVVDVVSRALVCLNSSESFRVVDCFGCISSVHDPIHSVHQLFLFSGELSHVEETLVSVEKDDIRYQGHSNGRMIILVNSSSMGIQIWAQQSALNYFEHAALAKLNIQFCSLLDISAANLFSSYDRFGRRDPVSLVVQYSARDQSLLTFINNKVLLQPHYSQEMNFGNAIDRRIIPICELLPSKFHTTGDALDTEPFGLIVTSRLRKQSSLLLRVGEGSGGSFETICATCMIQDEMTINAFSIRNSVILQITPTRICAFSASITSTSLVSNSSLSHKRLWMVSIKSLIASYKDSKYAKEMQSIQGSSSVVSSAVMGHNILYLSIRNLIFIIYIAVDQIPFSTGNAENGTVSCVSMIDLVVERTEIRRLHGVSLSVASSAINESHYGVSCIMASFWNSCDVMVHTYFTSSMGHKANAATGGGGSTMYKRDTSYFSLPTGETNDMITEATMLSCGGTVLVILATSTDHVYVVELHLPSNPISSGSENLVTVNIVRRFHFPHVIDLLGFQGPLKWSCNSAVYHAGFVAIQLPYQIFGLFIQMNHVGWSVQILTFLEDAIGTTCLVVGTISPVVQSTFCLSLMWLRSVKCPADNTEIVDAILFQGNINIPASQSITRDVYQHCEQIKSISIGGLIRCVAYSPTFKVVVGIIDCVESGIDGQRNFDWNEEGDIGVSLCHSLTDGENFLSARQQDLFIAHRFTDREPTSNISRDGIIRFPLDFSIQNILKKLQNKTSMVPMEISVIVLDPCHHQINYLLGLDSHTNLIGSAGKSPLCHLICIDSWQWSDIVTGTADPLLENSLNILNTLHFLTVAYNESAKSVSLLSRVSYDFFDVEIMKFFQRGDAYDGYETFDFGSRLQHYPVYCAGLEDSDVDESQDTTLLVILTQDGKLQVLGWETQIMCKNPVQESKLSSEKCVLGVETTAKDLNDIESKYSNSACVTIVASCLTMANSEYYYFFNQTEEVSTAMATQTKFARDKLFHQYTNELTLGQYDIYQGMNVHDCFIAVSICLYGVKLYRLSARRDFDKRNHDYQYNLECVSDVVDKTLQMIKFWTISKRGNDASDISAVVKVFGYDRSEVFSDQNPEKKYMRVITFTLFNGNQSTPIQNSEPVPMGSMGKSEFCFSAIPSIFAKGMVSKIVPKEYLPVTRYSTEELNLWKQITDIDYLLRESFDIFDDNGDLCII